MDGGHVAEVGVAEASADAHGKRRKLLRRLLITAGVLAILAVVVYGVFMLVVVEAAKGLGEYLSYDDGCLGSGPPYDLAVVEERVGLTFPPSARQIEADSETSPQDCFVYVRFEVAASDLDSLLASSSITGLARRLGSDVHPFGSWSTLGMHWEFDEDTTYLYGRGEASPYILVDTTGSETYTVYVIKALM